MTRYVYVDATAGVAGDMMVAALAGAGVPEEVFTAALAALPSPGSWSLALGTTTRGGLRATTFTVHASGDHPERRYPDVIATIEASALSDGVKTRALRALTLLGEAEARVHGVPLEDVHLHEVAAVDSIADIVCASAGFEHLAPARVVGSPVRLGTGQTRGAHGVLPVPAPATAELLKGIPVLGGGEGETATPTGAALLRANCDAFGDPPDMVLRSIGYGAGSRDTERPNVVRIFVGDGSQPGDTAPSVVVEANLDDMSPELAGPLIDELLAAGADDAWLTPVVMKKGRPAVTVSALTDAAHEAAVIDAMFEHSTTFGVRSSRVAKHALERSWVEVAVAGRAVRIKLAYRNGRIATAAPEYEDAVRVARAARMPLKDVYRAALTALQQDLPAPGPGSPAP